MSFLRLSLWRFIRLILGMLLTVLSVVHELPAPFRFPFGLAGGYLLFNEVIAFLVLGSRRQLHRIRVRYSFLSNATEWFFCKAGDCTTVAIVGGFTQWMPSPMRRMWPRSVWWYAGFPLSPGEYQYGYLARKTNGEESWLLDDVDERLIGSDLRERSVRIVLDSVRFPKARLQFRPTLIQVLIAIAGVMIGFIGRSSSGPAVTLSLKFLLSSIMLGVLYMLVLGGSIAEDKTLPDGAQIVVSSKFHESMLEVILNLEVVLLILGASAFFATNESSIMPLLPISATSRVLK